ncbi:hypothetical protein LCGC14_1561920 [marine sediment metagenome]|uniref:Uncharacterized protein n=1 Tax=marine sediment metagenome TaxID=412755 RepID=A0A0F9LMX7_9ZZZZ
MKEKKIRNDLIRTLYKPGLGGTIGRAQNPPISRQRVFQIVSEKPQVSIWGRLKRWLIR